MTIIYDDKDDCISRGLLIESPCNSLVNLTIFDLIRPLILVTIY